MLRRWLSIALFGCALLLQSHAAARAELDGHVMEPGLHSAVCQSIDGADTQAPPSGRHGKHDCVSCAVCGTAIFALAVAVFSRIVVAPEAPALLRRFASDAPAPAFAAVRPPPARAPPIYS
jgi:hypothetical protein